MGQPLRLLMVEDSEDDAQLIVCRLRQDGYDLAYERVETADALRAALARQTWDLILSDYAMPHFSGLAALTVLQESGLDLPFIVVSGTIGEETAVAVMKAGAHDYLMKQNLTRLAPAVERELREAQGRRERKQVEAQLRQAQKMEAIGRLAGGVAHDFNNMLGAMIGHCDLLLHQIGDNETVRGSLQEVMKAGERAATLTRQLLLFSRKEVLTPQVLDLNEAIASMEKMLGRLIGEDVEVVTVLDPRLGRVMADPGHLDQVLMNLAVNARDAMPEGGKLTVETKNVELDAVYGHRHSGMQPGPYVLLAVSDTGCGMDAETQSHIFEPFFTTKEPDRGTGLGLATVYGIVQQCGGHIEVESEPGRGATFRIYLPRIEGPVQPERKASEWGGLSLGSETILLVEDEPLLKGLLEQALRMHGYTVLEAMRGDEALRLCEQHAGAIDLLLTDVVMPGMNGRELAQRIVALRPEIKVLLMSGYMDDAVVRHGVSDGSIALLRKPFTPGALAGKVREVLGSSAAGNSGFLVSPALGDRSVKLKALIVDDSEMIRSLLKQLLPLTGLAEFQLIEARDGVEGWEILSENTMDLVFVDREMPGMNGIDFIRKVRASGKTDPIGIVMVTGQRTRGNARHVADGAGADVYLPKPFTLEELREKLTGLLGRLAAERHGHATLQRSGI
jgi:two-component system cell cycle sensor histidine kinase/response regulator CckA